MIIQNFPPTRQLCLGLSFLRLETISCIFWNFPISYIILLDNAYNHNNHTNSYYVRFFVVILSKNKLSNYPITLRLLLFSWMLINQQLVYITINTLRRQVITTLGMPTANTIIAMPTNNTVPTLVFWNKICLLVLLPIVERNVCKKLIQTLHPLYRLLFYDSKIGIIDKILNFLEQNMQFFLFVFMSNAK